MIAVDTNILVYAHREDSPFHERAFLVLADLAEGRTAWAIPWPCIHEFFAIATHPRIYSPPTPMIKAVSQVDAWLESPSCVMLGEEAGYWQVAGKLIRSSKIQGPQIHDAHIAAICILYGVTELYTSDRDFGRFAPLKTRNPLVDEKI